MCVHWIYLHICVYMFIYKHTFIKREIYIDLYIYTYIEGENFQKIIVIITLLHTFMKYEKAP